VAGLLLGVDGGNTKTVALVARLDGTIVGAGRAGCADIYGAESPEAAVAEIVSAVEGALAESGEDVEELQAAAFSLA
jgi:N-acetylglucosamine kinase-like BadF-type ATPase